MTEETREECAHANTVMISADVDVRAEYCPDCGRYETSHPVRHSTDTTLTEALAQATEWALQAFGHECVMNEKERNHRFFEEALELVQACGMSEAEAMMLVGYVYGRPKGEKSQELAGVLVTLMVLSFAQGLSPDGAFSAEIERIKAKIDLIREKQKAKPREVPKHDAEGYPADWHRVTVMIDPEGKTMHHVGGSLDAFVKFVAGNVGVVDTCDSGHHKFLKRKDHPLNKDGKPRCPYCMAQGLDALRNLHG